MESERIIPLDKMVREDEIEGDDNTLDGFHEADLEGEKDESNREQGL